MDIKLCKQCNEQISGPSRYTKNRTFCSSECSSKWQKANLSINHGLHGVKMCPKCAITKTLDNFSHKSGGRIQSYCKPCQYSAQMRRWNNQKVRAIKYLGNVCQKCGWSGHPALFDFHHVDPTSKKYEWNKLRLRSWSSITAELNKCQLLCCRCHRELSISPSLWPCATAPNGISDDSSCHGRFSSSIMPFSILQ